MADQEIRQAISDSLKQTYQESASSLVVWCHPIAAIAASAQLFGLQPLLASPLATSRLGALLGGGMIAGTVFAFVPAIAACSIWA